MNLFSAEKQQFKLPNAVIEYYPKFLGQEEADKLLQDLESQTNWCHDDITVFGKSYKQPRLTALYGSTDKPYSYSNIVMHPEPFTPLLLDIKEQIEKRADHKFNIVLLNLYRDGNDSNGWHADNEKELGEEPVIASLSLGEERPFHFKHRALKSQRHKLVLQHGSLLIMKGEMQHYWLHQIAKTKKQIGMRLNLTFRTLLNI